MDQRASVWHYLVVLALLPSLSLAAAAGLFARERLAAADTADRIGQAALGLRALDSLRLALESEAGTSVIDDTLADLGTSPDAVNPLGGPAFDIPLPEIRRATDATIQDVRGRGAAGAAGAPFRAMAGELDGIARDLTTLRATVDEPAAPATDQRRAHAWGVVTGFRALTTRIALLQRTAATAVATYDYGTAEADLSAAAAELAAVSRVALLGNRRASAFALFTVVPAGGVPGLVAELRDVDAAYRLAAADLPGVLSEDLRTSWQAFATSDATLAFDGLMSAFLAQATTGGNPPGAAQTLVTARSAGLFSQGLVGLTVDAVSGVTAVAGTERVAAKGAARTAIAAAVAIIALTGGTLVAVGAALRRRLRDGQGADADTLMSLTAQVTDAIREGERLQQELTHAEAHDALTELVNRAEGERRIAAALQRSREEGTRVGLLVVDLDHFHELNERHGTAAGDHVLQVCAARLEARVRGRDVVCRFGGDQFVVLLDPVASEFAAIDVGERIVASISQPILWDGHEMFVAASVGAATVVTGGAEGELETHPDLQVETHVDADELLARADAALHRAKAAGRAGVVAR